MKQPVNQSQSESVGEEAASEILILSGGKIFAHNITPAMARVLSQLNPADAAMRQRAEQQNLIQHELPN